MSEKLAEGPGSTTLAPRLNRHPRSSASVVHTRRPPRSTSTRRPSSWRTTDDPPQSVMVPRPDKSTQTLVSEGAARDIPSSMVRALEAAQGGRSRETTRTNDAIRNPRTMIFTPNLLIIDGRGISKCRTSSRKQRLVREKPRKRR